jgi:hypothetical protein
MNSFEDQVRIFTGEIVKKSNNSEALKKNVLKYKSFLVNTKLISINSEISKWIDFIITNAKIIISIKELYGDVDLDAFTKSIGIYESRSNEVMPDNKHYGHYHSYSSDSCGSSISNDSCSSGYQKKRIVSSSSCGDTPITTDRC